MCSPGHTNRHLMLQLSFQSQITFCLYLYNNIQAAILLQLTYIVKRSDLWRAKMPCLLLVVWGFNHFVYKTVIVAVFAGFMSTYFVSAMTFWVLYTYIHFAPSLFPLCEFANFVLRNEYSESCVLLSFLFWLCVYVVSAEIPIAWNTLCGYEVFALVCFIFLLRFSLSRIPLFHPHLWRVSLLGIEF